MDKTEKGQAKTKGSPEVPSEDETEEVCEKAFTPETARNSDSDEACKDGVG
jgi:hypothetical protein